MIVFAQVPEFNLSSWVHAFAMLRGKADEGDEEGDDSSRIAALFKATATPLI